MQNNTSVDLTAVAIATGVSAVGMFIGKDEAPSIAINALDVDSAR